MRQVLAGVRKTNATRSRHVEPHPAAASSLSNWQSEAAVTTDAYEYVSAVRRFASSLCKLSDRALMMPEHTVTGN